MGSLPGAVPRRPLLRRCLAVRLQRRRQGAPGGANGPPPPPTTTPDNEASDFWMYDSGYLLFQSFLEANLKCFWNPALREAVSGLEFRGYVHPGVLLMASPVHGDACLDRVRNAWVRNVLKPPADHVIVSLGDMEELAMVPICRGSFTPLPEALCWVVLELTSAGEAASLAAVRAALDIHFPGIKSPSESVVYDALAALMVDGKVYQTANGYYVVTPESKRRSIAGMIVPECPRAAAAPKERPQMRRGTSSSTRFSSVPSSPASSIASSKCRVPLSCPETSLNGPMPSTRCMLMSMDEAMAKVHGEMETVREGHITHQAVQTNLADVICGGNPNDKVLYGRKVVAAGRWGGSPGRPRSNSLRLFGSKRRATSASSLVGHSSPSPPPSAVAPSRHRRSASLRLYPSSCASLSSSSSSSSSASSTSPSPLSEPQAAGNKKGSLLSRLFRRTGSLSWRHKRNGNTVALLPTFSAQFPPAEWFNPSVAHLHSVGTQTSDPGPTVSSSPPSPVVVRSKLARSQGSLPSLSQRSPASEQPSSCSHRASTLPRPRNRQLCIPQAGKVSTQVAPISHAPSSSPSIITTSSRRSLASSTPASCVPSTMSSRSPRSDGSWTSKVNGSASLSSSKATAPTACGRSNGCQVADKVHTASKLASPPAGGKGSVVTLQVSSPPSNYSLSFNGTTMPASVPLPNHLSGFGTTTTMTTSTSFTSPGGRTTNDGDGIRGRAEVSVQARQYMKPEGDVARVSPLKSVVQLEGDGHHVVVLSNVAMVTKMSEKAAVEPSAATSPVSEDVSQKQCTQPDVSHHIDSVGKTEHTEEEVKNCPKELTVVRIGGSGLSNEDNSPSEESVGGSSDASVSTGPFENGITLMEFKSLAAQRILQGLSANSIDTLVEVNMAAAARKGESADIIQGQSPTIGTNYDLTVHTDFGMV